VTNKMKRVLKIITAIVAAAAIITVGAFAYRYVQQRSKPAEQQADRSAARVRTAIVRARTVEESLTLTGEIKAVAVVEVKPKIPGRLERLALEDGTPVVEGTLVRKGEVIAVLEHKDLQARVAQAKAAIETAKAGVLVAEVVLKDRKREKVRMENLFKQGSATEQQRDRAVTDCDRATAALEQAKAQLAQALAALQLAEVTFQEAFLKSPLKGVVCEKRVDPGAMVGPETSIVCVQPMDELKFLVAIPGEILPKIDPDKTAVTISVDAYRGRQFKSRISKVYPTVDPVTRTATVEILIRNERGDRGEYLLRPGMYATARIVVARKDQAVAVPVDALIRRLGKHYAFVVQDDVARRREVKLGLRSGEYVEVVKGLSAGEEIVVSGQHRLTDGPPIERVRGSDDGGQRQ